jgi:glycosyltransferase involved in cell wall biosynthesis
VWQKGLDLLLAAATNLAALHPDGWTLTLVGGGAMQGRIEARIRRDGLEKFVSVKDHIDNIHDFWRSHHVLVMPSRAEGLSLALTEAMLCGRPAIASLVAGTAELLDDGVTGLACYLDAGHLAEKMREAINLRSQGSLQGMGKAAAAKTRQVFPPNPEEMFLQQLEEFLASQHCGAGK